MKRKNENIDFFKLHQERLDIFNKKMYIQKEHDLLELKKNIQEYHEIIKKEKEDFEKNFSDNNDAQIFMDALYEMKVQHLKLKNEEKKKLMDKNIFLRSVSFYNYSVSTFIKINKYYKDYIVLKDKINDFSKNLNDFETSNKLSIYNDKLSLLHESIATITKHIELLEEKFKVNGKTQFIKKIMFLIQNIFEENMIQAFEDIKKM